MFHDMVHCIIAQLSDEVSLFSCNNILYGPYCYRYCTVGHGLQFVSVIEGICTEWPNSSGDIVCIHKL